MNRAIGKILRYERIYNRKKDAGSAHIMALSYYMGYIVSGQQDMLYKANFALTQAAHQADVGLVFLRAFIAYELENYELFSDLLSQLRPLRNAMKANKPRLYAYYLYFDCLLDLTNQKARAASRNFKALNEYYEQQKVPDAEILLASLNLIYEDTDKAFVFLHKAYTRGERSPLFFVCLLRTFNQSRPRNFEGELLLPLIMWALNSGCYIENIVSQNQALAEALLRRRPKMAQSIYSRYSMDWVLHIITTAKMIENDISEEAFYYYKKADERQLHFGQLYDFLLRSAHKNGIEDISGYSLYQYISNEKSISEDILPFIYHLVLKGALGGRHSEILERVKGDIAAFACRCLQNHLFGKYYYSMYKFLLGTDVFVESKYLNAAEEIIKQILFAYDIFANDGRTKKIVVQEEFKKQNEPLALKEGRCRVSMWSGSAQIIGFDEDLRNIISKKPTATRLLENADLTLYKYFFRKGHQPLDLLIYLSNHYLQADQNNLPDEAVLVFKKTIATAGIDRAFLRMIHAALGNYYVRKKDFSKAAQYFKDLDEAAVNKQYLEGMLAAYISAKDYLSATRLAARWAGDISDKALFNAIKQMTPHIGGLNAKKSVAHAAAKLILNGWHDEDLLGLVLAHYDAPLAFWAELYKTLVSFGVFSNALCKKILETSMLARVCNKNVQSVFVNLAQNAPNEDGILTDYAIYLAYEIMINDLLPTNDTILAMEDIFVQSGQILLAYSLAIVYITRDEAKREYMREKSQKILDVALATAKRTDIIFPIFKEIKDKTTLLPYIEKNSPFVYKGKAQNEVVLHYRFNNNAEYSQKPMKYLAFGMHLCHLTHFYGENIEYYFSENMGGSSVKTAPQILANNNSHMLEKTSDLYYTIHNALVYEQMFKYDKVEEIVDAHLAQKNSIRAKII